MVGCCIFFFIFLWSANTSPVVLCPTFSAFCAMDWAFVIFFVVSFTFWTMSAFEGVLYATYCSIVLYVLVSCGLLLFHVVSWLMVRGFLPFLWLSIFYLLLVAAFELLGKLFQQWFVLWVSCQIQSWIRLCVSFSENHTGLPTSTVWK